MRISLRLHHDSGFSTDLKPKTFLIFVKLVLNLCYSNLESINRKRVRALFNRLEVLIALTFCLLCREVMDIPSSLVSEAEEAIKMKLKPLLDQAQV